jgi:hypothetical protein
VNLLPHQNDHSLKLVHSGIDGYSQRGGHVVLLEYGLARVRLSFAKDKSHARMTAGLRVDTGSN